MSGSAKLFKCPVCDTVIEILDHCGLEITCCGPEMIELTEKTCTVRKPHALVTERAGGMVKVRVGNPPHPMDDDHYIAWIELVSDGQSCRRFLSPGEPPEAVFSFNKDQCTVRAYCNAHGLWRSSEGHRAKPRQLAASASA